MEIRFKMLMNIESSFCWSVEGLSQMLFIGLWPGFNALRKGDGMLRQRRNLVLWLVRIALCLMLFNIDNVPNKQFLISIMLCFGLLRKYEVRVGRTWVMTPLRIMWGGHQASLANDISLNTRAKLRWFHLCHLLLPHICHFFTRAKFLENKIYTEKRQFFALNL